MRFILNDDNYKEKEYVLTGSDLTAINALIENKYATWEWNYGESLEVEKAKDMKAVSC